MISRERVADTHEIRTAAVSGGRFESPLSLWIAIWQRQLVYGRD
jgi:hypothetical protein